MILDTNGLLAVAEGEPGLEAILRRAAQVAFLSLFWVNAGTGFHSLATTITMNDGSPSICRAFEFSMSMSRPPSSIVLFAGSSSRLELLFPRTTFGLQHYAANIPCLC